MKITEDIGFELAKNTPSQGRTKVQGTGVWRLTTLSPRIPSSSNRGHFKGQNCDN